MEQTIECLRCGERRDAVDSRPRWLSRPECPRCGYLGWASSSELTEPIRRLLRERPPETRRLRLVS